jgi:voltage-gated potassium channel
MSQKKGARVHVLHVSTVTPRLTSGISRHLKGRLISFGPLRSHVSSVLDPHGRGSLPRAAVKALVLLVIAASAVAIVVETVDALANRYRLLLVAIEIGAVVTLTLDYLLRLWVAPESEPGGATDPWGARVRYAASAFGIIDLLAVLPFLAGQLFPIDPGWLRVLRLLRLLKLSRYASGLSLLAVVIRNESRPLLAALMVMAVLLMLASAVMFVLERDTQPEVFSSIPHTMWWAIVTMATIGYGDMIPVTLVGRMIGALVMILGMAMFALPAGILATGFTQEIRKRDFVVTWQTVATMPLFAGLDAARIAEIARLLKRQVVPPRYEVVRRGEPADAMFFILSGKVEVELHPEPVRLGGGQYFGEIALLHDAVRTATVTTLTECELLALDAADFRRLLDAHPALKASITQVAEERLAAITPTPSVGPSPPSAARVARPTVRRRV